MNGWHIIPNPPLTEDLFSTQKNIAWETLKQQLPLGTKLSGPVYIQAHFGVFYDAGLGFPVLINVPEFDRLEGGLAFPADYPPLGSVMSGELAQFDGRLRQLRTIRRYLPDFRVIYRLYEEAEGGHTITDHQALRLSARYEQEALNAEVGDWTTGPQFLGPGGTVLPAGPLPLQGQADMFCSISATRVFHRQHLRPGVRGYFIEGGRCVGVWEVAEVLGLRQP